MPRETLKHDSPGGQGLLGAAAESSKPSGLLLAFLALLPWLPAPLHTCGVLARCSTPCVSAPQQMCLPWCHLGLKAGWYFIKMQFSQEPGSLLPPGQTICQLYGGSTELCACFAQRAAEAAA